MVRSYEPGNQICTLGSLWPGSNVQQPHRQEEEEEEEGSRERNATAGPSKDRPKQCHSTEEAEERALFSFFFGWPVKLLHTGTKKSQNPDPTINSVQPSKCGRLAPNWQNTTGALESKWLELSESEQWEAHLARLDSL